MLKIHVIVSNKFMYLNAPVLPRNVIDFYLSFLCVLLLASSSILVFCFAPSAFVSITSASHPIDLISVLISRAAVIVSTQCSHFPVPLDDPWLRQLDWTLAESTWFI